MNSSDSGALLLESARKNQLSNVVDQLQSKEPPQLSDIFQSLQADSAEELWTLLFQSTELEVLRNLIDLLSRRHTPGIVDPKVLCNFPFDTILELEANDFERTQWLIHKYLDLYEAYRAGYGRRSLMLPPETRFSDLIVQHVQRLPHDEQIRYKDYATTEVIESSRTVAEKIARGVRFPSGCDTYHVHCLVLGNAGVGKSTLVNVAHDLFEKVFDEAIGGSSLTTKYASLTRTYERPRDPKEDSNSIPETVPVAVTFTDSPGPSQRCKTRDREDAVDEFQQFLEWFHADIETRPHMVLYCINSSANRITDYQYFWLISLARFVPVILVMTSSFSRGKRDEWERDHLSRDNFRKIGVMAHVFVNLREEVDETYTIPRYGLNRLASVVCSTYNKNIREYLDHRQVLRDDLSGNDVTRTRLHVSCRAIWTSGVLSSITAGSIPAAWVNDAATVAVISSMLSAMTAAYGLTGIVGLVETWDLLKKSLLRVGLVQASAVGGLLVVDQLANFLMTVPWIGSLLGSSLSGTCSGVAAFFCGKIWWAALEKYRLSYRCASDDPHEFLVEAIEKAAQEAWISKAEMITEMNDMIRKEQQSAHK